MKKKFMLNIPQPLYLRLLKRAKSKYRTLTGEILLMLEGIIDAEENDKRQRKNASKNNKGSI